MVLSVRGWACLSGWCVGSGNLLLLRRKLWPKWAALEDSTPPLNFVYYFNNLATETPKVFANLEMVESVGFLWPLSTLLM
jgi:hypothetical protein